jgi:hypothetical protein
VRTGPDNALPTGEASSATSQPYSSTSPSRCSGTVAAALRHSSAGYSRSDSVEEASDRQGRYGYAGRSPFQREFSCQRLHRRARGARVGHRGHAVVGGDGHVDNHPRACGPHRLLEGRPDIASVDQHRRAAARKLARRGLAEVRPAAGDERNLAVEHATSEHPRVVQRLLPHDLDHEPLRTPAVELAVEHLLPRS